MPTAFAAAAAVVFSMFLAFAPGSALVVPSAPAATTQQGNSPYLVTLQRESVPVKRKGEILSHKTSYWGTITFGQPAQEFRVVFDTGSGHVVLPSVECKTKTCTIHRRYNMTKSTSAIPINVDGTVVPEGDLSDQVTIGYGTGQVTGEFVKDQVCIGAAVEQDSATKDRPARPCKTLHVVMAVEMSKQPFKSFGFDGILGLGLNSLSLSKDFSFFEQLAQDTKSSTPHFGVFLTDGEDGDQSEIAFGGHNTNRLLGSLSWTSVINPDLGYWQVQLRDVRVDGHSLGLCEDGSCRAVLDTGTSHLGIPTPYDKTLGDLLLQPADDVMDCRRIKGPTLQFEFDGFNMTLYPEDYMRQLPLMEGVEMGSSKGLSMERDEKPPTTKVNLQPAAQAAAHNAARAAARAAEMRKSSSRKECRPRLMPVNLPAPLGPNLFILGEPVLHRYYTVFDWMGPRVGFGLASKQRYADPAKMLASGEVLRDDVKAILSSIDTATQSTALADPSGESAADEVMLVQLAFDFHCRSA